MLCQCSINTDSTTQSQQRIIVIPTRECCLPRPQKDRLHFPEYMTSEMPSAFTWDCFCHFPRASQVALMVQNLSTNAGDIKDRDAVGLIPGLIPWRRKWQPTPVFLSAKSHGQRSLADYSPWGCKELDTTEMPARTHTGVFLHLCMDWASFSHLWRGS